MALLFLMFYMYARVNFWYLLIFCYCKTYWNKILNKLQLLPLFKWRETRVK